MIPTNEISREELALILNQNEMLNDSLRYAFNLQLGMLPKRRHFLRIWPQTSVFYRAKDIVSGDFYYISENGSKVHWSVGDCSGHGVPGAMLTMLGMSFLNYAIQNRHAPRVGDILEIMDDKLCETFMFDDAPEHIDIALVSYDKKKNKVEYAGARRKMIVIRNGKTHGAKGNGYPLGGLQIEKDRRFDTLEVDVKKGDYVYIGSDGYQDQFGGDKGKKYTSKRLSDTLARLAQYEQHFQKIMLLQEFKEWKGENDQIDDVCLMGIGL